MSAYQVSNATIDAITAGLAFFGIKLTKTDADGKPNWRQCWDARHEPEAVAQALLDQNLRSLAARYSDMPFMPQTFAGNAAFRRAVDRALDGYQPRALAALFGAVKCFRYQACESRDWDGHPVNFATQTLIVEITTALFVHCDVEREEIPWDLTGIENFREPENLKEQREERHAELAAYYRAYCD